MSAEVTLTLPDTLLERAQRWAEHSGRSVDELLAEAIELSLSPLGEAPKPVASWTDAELTEACDSESDVSDERRLSELLEFQRESQLTKSDAAELRQRMVVYQEGLLRKAIALREAVRRGLREPLAS